MATVITPVACGVGSKTPLIFLAPSHALVRVRHGEENTVQSGQDLRGSPRQSEATSHQGETWIFRPLVVNCFRPRKTDHPPTQPPEEEMSPHDLSPSYVHIHMEKARVRMPRRGGW